MSCGAKTIAVLTVCLAVVTAIRSPFPRDKPLRYSYYGDIKAGLIEPAAYASQYTISGNFYVKPDRSDPQYQNAFIVALANVKTGLYNGLANHYERAKSELNIPEAARAIEKPFLLVYNDDGQLSGVKISTDEPGWSKNMKLAIATSFQIDLPSIKLDLPIKPQSFISKENTIHGDCWVSYNVNPRDSYSTNNAEVNNDFTIIKFGSPRNCTGYNVFAFNHVDDERCDAPAEKPVNMASRKVYQAEQSGDSILIKLLVAHGGVNYFPWRGRSEAHYVLNNATFVLEDDQSQGVTLPEVNFRNLPLITDISYQKPESRYADKTAVDVTHGRHQVNQHELVDRVKEMLAEGADYLQTNHMDPIEPNYNEGHIMNRILDAMSFMEVSSLSEISRHLIERGDSRTAVMKRLFMGILPHVGTHATTTFIGTLVTTRAEDLWTTMQLLTKFPLNVRNPNEQLLNDMDILLYISGPRSSGNKAPDIVRKTGMLNFASLVFRTFKNTPNPEANELLNKYINYLYDLAKKPIQYTEFDANVVALMALRNIQVGRVFEVLTPLIKGDVRVEGTTDLQAEQLRLLAIWAVEKSIPTYQAAHDVFWSIMADYSQPLKLRIAAYDILIRQEPTMTNILHIYWFMVYEKSEQLYNYHHTTIKGFANSVDPCESKLKELATKILRFTRIHSPVPYKLSGSYMIDAVDEVYGHGEKFSVSYTLSEQSANVDVVTVEQSMMEGGRRVVLWKLQVITTVSDLWLDVIATFGASPIPRGDISKVLKEAAKEIKQEDPAVNIIFSLKNRVVYAGAFPNIQAIGGLIQTIMALAPTPSSPLNGQYVFYDYLFEQQVISEMGLPIALENKVPKVLSYSLDRVQPNGIAVDLRLWRHGDYSMSIYNPLYDLWHSVARSTAVDLQLPLKLSFSPSNANGNQLEITVPILPADRYSVKGIKFHAKDVTTITPDKEDSLKKSCADCGYFETVTKGARYKKTHEISSVDSKNSGLHYSHTIFDCETDVTKQMFDKNMLRSLYKNPKNIWGFEVLNVLLAQRQYLKNMVISPEMGSCGVIAKVEPSINHPTSELTLGFKVSAENTDDQQGSLHTHSGKKFNLRMTTRAVSALTNESARSWDLNLNFDLNQGHTSNTMNLRLTAKTPGKKSLQICLSGHKTYPPIPDDPLKVGVTKEETHGKLTFTMAETDVDECVRDQTLIIIGSKGEISEEQKRSFNSEQYNSGCYKDTINPLYSTKAGLVPRTVNCLDFAMKYTSLRKYTLNIAYANVPPAISETVTMYEDAFKAFFQPHLEYTRNFTEDGTAKIVARFPMRLDHVDVSVATPDSGYDFIGAEITRGGSFGSSQDVPMLEGFGPDTDKHLWIPPLDNTRFESMFVQKYTAKTQKLCSIYPHVVLTLDGGEIPYNISEQWTLASGDVVEETYAIFVKSVKGVVGLQIHAGSQKIEFLPGTEEYTLKINDEETSVSRLYNGTYVPEDAPYWTLKATKYGETNSIEFSRVSVQVIHSLNSVSLFVGTGLQGKIAGLCGILDGSHKSRIANEYRLIEGAA